MQIEPNTVAAQVRLLAGMIEDAALAGRGLAVRQLLDGARRLDELAGDPEAEVIVERMVPGHMLTAWGEPLVGFEHLDE
jgi:predicted regulator of amino acid metabolism with ACT domain